MSDNDTQQIPCVEDTAYILGYPVHLVTSEQAVELCDYSITQDERKHVITINPEMLMQARKNTELHSALTEAELVIPDGAGVVWAARRKGKQVDRLPGIELADALLEKAAEKNWKVAIIGATAEVLQATLPRIEAKHPGLNICFAHHGYFNDSEAFTVANDCAEKKPNLVLIALGVPRQEVWIREHRHLFNGTVFMGIGGSLDVWSGQKERAPDIMRKLNLEWMYRIATEPWRLKRTLKTLPLFVVKVVLSDN